MNKPSNPWIVIFLALTWTGTALGQGPADACRALARPIPSASIGSPSGGARIDSATLVRSDVEGNTNGDFCQVLGAILPVDKTAPEIRFQVNLPSRWNGKALHIGGGGWDGTLVTGLSATGGATPGSKTPLMQGYVTLGSDSGHQSQGASFTMNDESFRNFAGGAIKKTHDAAWALIRARYGRTPEHSYFIGGSQGGHEALIAVQNYPADFDGAVAAYPAYNFAMLHLATNALVKAIFGNGASGWMPREKVDLLQKTLYEACDGLDGTVDGIVSNVAGCNKAFNIDTVKAKLRCPNGADTGNTCLSDGQIEGVRKISSPFRIGFPLADGATEFPKWSNLDGASFRGAYGTNPKPGNPPGSGDPRVHTISDGSVRYLFSRNPQVDSINAFDPDDYRDRIVEASRLLDNGNADISAFERRGGKLVMIHGTVDELISPYNSINYYRKLVTQFGQGRLDAFVRFYIVPGYGHGNGLYDVRWDPLSVIDTWVSQSQAPGTLKSVDGNRGATRSRPMCVYPAWPKYSGKGDTNDAANFVCVVE